MHNTNNNIEEVLKLASSIQEGLMNEISQRDTIIQNLKTELTAISTVKSASTTEVITSKEADDILLKMANVNLINSEDIASNKESLLKDPKMVVAVLSNVLEKVANQKSLEQGVAFVESTTKTASTKQPSFNDSNVNVNNYLASLKAQDNSYLNSQ